VYDAILDLYGKGEPADPVTVAAELTRAGNLERVGGAPYLHTLISLVPIAANAGYYAEIVRERAILRRLVEAGTKVVQLGYGAAGGMGGDVDDVVDRAQAAVYEVVERRTSEDYVGLEAAMWATYNEIEAIGNRGGELFGVPTGFRDLDELTNGLHDGQLIVVAGRPGLGKALALDTRLATPTGWTTMGEVAVGDYLIGADGHPTRVVAATEVMTNRPCYEVHFDDGTVIVADEQHQWLTRDRAGSAVRTTGEIAASVATGGSRRQLDHEVALASPLDLPDRVLPVAPYTLGVWLSDGDPDPEVAMYVEGSGASVVPEAAALRALGSTPRRGIPQEYLRASQSQRRLLLAGLLDVGGFVLPNGSIQYSARSRHLAADVRELICSLGYRCETASTASTLTFSTEDDVFALERKRIAHKERRRPTRTLSSTRFITDVRRVESVPVRCVEVDNADHMYLAGESMVPTHNSTLGMDFLRSAAIGHQKSAVLFSLEMGKSEITMRLLSAEARIPLTRIRTGTLNDDDWTKLARRMGEVAQAPMFIDDSPNLTMMEIRAKARRLKQRHDLRLVVVDYLQLMTSPKRVENRQQEVAEMSRSLKLLAKELAVPVVAISQLNRGAEQRSDKRPQLSDLRESGAIEQDADMVILLHREDAYERESPRAGEADLIVAKHRNGPTRDVVVSSQLHYSRFVDMPHN
ncbi:MAG TPA: replicative DNA helicase, partial [Mycobacteriales bacterium]|nr:replicative DNA helicase [Mycobacteriales bacterium]